jgi:hypothetical protein
MGRFSPTVSTADAFRDKLRAIYPARPELADEIEDYLWFFHKRGLPEEDAAAREALKELNEEITCGKIRLRGTRNLSLPPEDIVSADARSGKLDVFDGVLEVLHNGKVVRTYYQVHCYEADLRPKAKTKPGPKTANIPKFVSDYIRDNPTTASLSGCREKWKTLHGASRREELDAEWRKQAKPKGLLRERGQRNQIAKI